VRHTEHEARAHLRRVRVGEGERHRADLQTVSVYSRAPGAPSRRTLYRWHGRLVRREPLVALAHGGRPPLLSEHERLAVGGWVLDRVDRARMANADQVCGFILQAFGVDVDRPYVSALMASLHLHSHRIAVKKAKYFRADLCAAVWSWLSDFRRRPTSGRAARNIIALDVQVWTNPTFCLRSYSGDGW
jgi:hypothetical protein